MSGEEAAGVGSLSLEEEPIAKEGPGIVDETTQKFMEETMKRVNKMKTNTALSVDKTQALRAGLSSAETEAAKEMMKEVESNPTEKPLDYSKLLEQQVKMRNTKFN